MAGMRVLLVDDHPLIQEVMQAVARRALGAKQMLIEENLAAGLARARESGPFDLVLLDLGLPDCGGLDALLRFREAFPQLPVVVVSATEDAGTVRAAIGHGARGYIPKSSPTPVIEAALKLVTAGGTYVPPAALDGAALDGLALTGRQREVLRLMARGLHNRQIAERLAISENTVKHHARAVFHALGVASRTEALVAATRLGLRFD
jgi:DNA-binding NarL/FixJ family response regulator